MKKSAPAFALARLAERYWEFCCYELPFSAILAGEDTADAVLFREAPADYDRRRDGAAALLAELSGISVAALNAQDHATARLLHRELQTTLDFHAVRAHLRPSLYPAGPDFNLLYFANSATAASLAAAERYVARLATVPAFLADLKSSLAAGRQFGFRYPGHVLRRATHAVRASLTAQAEQSPLYGPFKRSTATATAAVRRVGEEALRLIGGEIIPALAGYAGFLDDTLLPAARDSIACSDDLLGPEYYGLLVRNFTSLDLTAEEVHELGLAEVARLEAEIEGVAQAAGYGGNAKGYRQFLVSEKAFYAVSVDAHLEQVRALCKRIDRHIPAYFGRLPRITYGVECIPAGLAVSLPPAYAQPSPADNSAPGIFWLTSLTEKCPTYMYPSLALHEAWPGHLMQIALMQEQEQLPKFRRNGALKYTACIEGWAMYCELLGICMGLYATPAENFGRLNMEMWRAARLVVDTGIHVCGWSRDQAIAYLSALVSIPRDTVEAEVDRYIALPGQALAYQPGNLKFRELRARAEQALGDRFDLRHFHDALIAAGPVTLPVLDDLIEHWLRSQRDGNVQHAV